MISGLDIDGNVWSSVKMTEHGKSMLLSVANAVRADRNIVIKETTVSDEQGNPVKMKDLQIPKGSILSPEMINAINAGMAYSVDENENEIPINPGNANRYLTQDYFAFSRTTSNPSGLDITDRTSFMNMVNEKQYRSIAMPWDEYKASVSIPPSHIQAIEQDIAVEKPERLIGTTLDSGNETGYDPLLPGVAEYLEGQNR